MSYVFVNIVDEFQKLSIKENNNICDDGTHYISLIVFYIDTYGHYHVLNNQKRLYSYYPKDIYDKEFKFKKNIKGHIIDNFNIHDVRRVSHIKNVNNNHIYIVKLNSMDGNLIPYNQNTNDDLSWSIYFDVFNSNPIIYHDDHDIIRLNDLKEILK